MSFGKYLFGLVFVFASVALSSTEFGRFADSYFDEYLSKYPTFATATGFHQYDGDIEDYSKKGVTRHLAWLNDRLKALESFDTHKLSPSDLIDSKILANNIRAQIFDSQEMRGWERNPDYYSSGITQSAYVIISRGFSPEEERLKSLISRERKMPQALVEARANLKNPPKIYTEVAIEQVAGNIAFFESDVPKAFSSVTDKKLLGEFGKTNKALIAALKEYQSYLKKDVLPRSKGDFRIGAEKFQKKLLYDEMVALPLDQLLKIGFENLKLNQDRFVEVAKRLDPKRTAKEILAELDTDHPLPENLLSSVKAVNETLVKFLKDKSIVTLPSEVRPIVEETPPFMRALTFASMDTPGPFETKAKEAYYNVTLPEKDWPKARIDEHMAGFNRGTILSISVHEAYPGHYTQFLWLQGVPSKVRKLIGCSSNAEGWAHYSEQMMMDEGFAKDDLKMSLGQIQEALVRNARFIVGIQMHTGKMTYEEGVKFFVDEGYLSKANAERETKRGTSDPTYLYYTLGKLEIFKLREDYKKLRGKSYTLKDFHDTFLSQGFPPIPIVREIMLGSVGEVL